MSASPISEQPIDAPNSTLIGREPAHDYVSTFHSTFEENLLREFNRRGVETAQPDAQTALLTVMVRQLNTIRTLIWLLGIVVPLVLAAIIIIVGLTAGGGATSTPDDVTSYTGY